MSIGKICLVSAVAGLSGVAGSFEASAQTPKSVSQADPKGKDSPDRNPAEARGEARGANEVEPIIVVTALRRNTAEEEAAASTSVLTEEDIDDRGGISDPADLAEMLPGVNFVDSAGENNEINIRGSGAATQGSNDTDSSVAILRDGVQITGGNIAGKIFSAIDTFDLGQAEVVRGPQGALYGANAVGGVINLVTNRPKFVSGTSGKIGYAPAIDRFEVEAIANVPLSDTIAVRIGGAVQNRDGGFFYNSVLDEYGDRSSSKVGRLSLLYKPSSTFSNVTVIDVGSSTGSPSPIRTSRRPDPVTGAELDVDGPFRFGNNTRPEANNKEFMVTNTTNLYSGIGDFTAISSWRSGTRNILTDGDGGAPGYIGSPTVPALCRSQSCINRFFDNTSAFRQELRFSTRLSSAIDLIVGANYQNINTEYYILRDGYNRFGAPTVPNALQNNSAVTNRAEKQYGAFASAEFKLSRALIITLAGRYSRSDKDSLRYNVALSPAAGLTCPYLDPLSIDPFDNVCATKVLQLDRRFSSFQPSGSIRYAITPNFAVFASASKGYRPGGFNPNSVDNDDRANQTPPLPPIPETYGSEKTYAYELGTKLRLGKLLFTLTGYTNRYKDVAAIGLLEVEGFEDTGADRYRFNAGDARNYGVDAEISGRVNISPSLGNVRVQAAYNYVKGKYTSGVYDGFTMEGIPTETFTASATWQIPVASGWRLAVGGSWRGERGGFVKTNLIDNTFPRASLDVVKARVSLESGRYRFEIIGDNMLNEVYPVYQTRVNQGFADRRSVLFRISYALGSEERRMFGR